MHTMILDLTLVTSYKWLTMEDLKLNFSGVHKDAEEEMDEAMPSCFMLLMFDCLFMKIKKIFMPNSSDEFKDEAEEY